MTTSEFNKIKTFLKKHECYQVIEKHIDTINTYNIFFLNIWMDDGIIGFDDVYENILNLDYISPIK
jgi:hypothetical protein